MVILKTILNILPQKEPFVFVDEIVDYQRRDFLITMKRFTTNDSMLRNQINKYIPKTLIIEGATQSIIILKRLNDDCINFHGFMLIGKLKAEFFKEVSIGDSIYYHVGKLRLYNDLGSAVVNVILEKENIGEVSVFFKIMNSEL